MADYLEFSDIYEKIARIGGDESGAWTDKIKDIANMVYLDEILVCDDLHPMFWLIDLIDNVKTKDEATITGIVAATGVITAAAHGFVSGDIIQIDDIVGMTELNHRTFVVVKVTADTLTLTDLAGTAISTAAYTAYTSGGTMYHRGITLSKAFAKTHSFGWHGYNGQVDPISQRELEESAAWMNPGNRSRPTRHLHKPYYSSAGTKTDRLMWFPLASDNYEGRIWGELDVSPMVNDADVPQLPFKFHNAIITGSVARLVQYGSVQVENAVIWPGLYKAQLESIKSFNRAYWKQFKDQRSPIFGI